MLRITLLTQDDPPVFVLEGRLAGDGVKELIRVTQDVGPNTKYVFDIEDVSYVDRLGEEILLRLNRLGARFLTENVYSKDLCQQLHLRRGDSATLAPLRQYPRKRGKAPPGSSSSVFRS